MLDKVAFSRFFDTLRAGLSLPFWLAEIPAGLAAERTARFLSGGRRSGRDTFREIPFPVGDIAGKAGRRA